MRLHDRYLFRELLTPLAGCLGGFLVFWISYFFFTKTEEMREAGLHLFETLEYAAASLPEFFVLVLPFLLLLALLYALTHHARYNEITALRAAGVGLWRLCAPYFAVGLLAGGIYFALNELVVPRCADWSEEILHRHGLKPRSAATQTRFANVGFRNVRARHIWQIGEYDSTTATMINPNVTWTLPDGSWQALQARRADYTNGVWTFLDAQMFIQAGPRGNLVPSFSTNSLALPEFDETPGQILLQIKFSDAQGLLASHSADVPLSELWPYLRQNPDLPAKEAAKLLTKFYGRLAAPWTCLVVVLIAIPFGAQSGRRNLFFGVAGSIFICFAYFVLQQVGLAFGLNGYLPGWLAAWLPNLIFAAAGIVLTMRVR
jgi:lipopolysaccharide export system permease protein